MSVRVTILVSDHDSIIVDAGNKPIDGDRDRFGRGPFSGG